MHCRSTGLSTRGPRTRKHAWQIKRSCYPLRSYVGPLLTSSVSSRAKAPSHKGSVHCSRISFALSAAKSLASPGGGQDRVDPRASCWPHVNDQARSLSFVGGRGSVVVAGRGAGGGGAEAEESDLFRSRQ
jgi:hypothetical protein